MIRNLYCEYDGFVRFDLFSDYIGGVYMFCGG